jgi:hypothetical protein
MRNKLAVLVLVALAMSSAGCGPPSGVTPGEGDGAAGEGAIDAAAAADGALADAGDEGCTSPGADCTCVEQPPLAGSCVHSFGGVYANGGCSGSYQCCDGVFENCTDCCGSCTCTDTTGVQGCSPPGEGELSCFPAFEGEAVAIPDAIRQQMIGRSWHEELPCPSLDSLSLLRMTHWGMDGEIHEGELIVASSVAGDVLQAFRHIYDARFPIERMTLIHHYEGDDDASMADNNTSAFNCRLVTGGTSLSEHGLGTAIDINPVQNPYVRGDTVLPPAGRDYLERSDVRPGMIVRPGPVLDAFEDIGWEWGGDFSTLDDYQHVSEGGR